MESSGLISKSNIVVFVELIQISFRTCFICDFVIQKAVLLVSPLIIILFLTLQQKSYHKFKYFSLNQFASTMGYLLNSLSIYEISLIYNIQLSHLSQQLTSNSLNNNLMTQNSGFDWYQLSKLNEDSPQIQQFANLIKKSHFGLQLSRVPNSLRQKLLQTFQNSSQLLKNKYQQQQKAIQQLVAGKMAIKERTNAMKQLLQNSIQRINSDKVVIQQKKKTVARLKQKIRKKEEAKNKQKQQKNEKQQNFFCPFCTREDFASKAQFSIHMHKQHANGVNINNSSQHSSQPVITSEFRELLLSLKDKEIQLMEMMLNKKKQIETIELQNAYTQQLRRIKTQANFMERKSMYTTTLQQKHKNEQLHGQQQQLKGQSQYLFYKPDNRTENLNHNNRNVGIHQQMYEMFRPHFSENMSANDPPNRHYQHNYGPNNYDQQMGYAGNQQSWKNLQQRQQDYYNIFNSQFALSQIDNSIPSQRNNQISPQKMNRFKTQQKQPSVLSKSQLSQDKAQASIYKNINRQKMQVKPLQNIPTQAIQSKLYTSNNININNLDNYLQNSSPSPTPSLNTERKYGSVYAPSKSNISKFSQGHIFNSGPLIDDSGGDSDFQMYFGGQADGLSDQVQDEEIKLVIKPTLVSKKSSNPSQKQFKNQQSHPSIKLLSPEPNANRNSSDTSRANQSNVLLQYSKDKSMLNISDCKQKSSDLIELSNSFSKRALDSSKNNDETINLSDLKLSKLDRAKEIQRQKLKNMQNERQKNQQIEVPVQRHHFMYNDRTKKQSEIQNVVTSFMRPSYNQDSRSRSNNNSYSNSNPSILQQFKRDSQLQLQLHQRMQSVSINKTQKPNQSVNANPSKLRLPENIQLFKTNPGVLDEFFYKNRDQA